MADTKKAAWVGGTALAAVVVLGGGWLGLVQPTLTSASEVKQRAEDQKDHNQMLEVQIAQLKKDFDQIETFRTDLAALQTQIPTTGQLSQLSRQLEAAAADAGVTIIVSAPGTPTPFAPVATTDAPAPTADAASAGGSTTAPTTGTAAGATGQAASKVVTIPLSVTTVGSYADTQAFVKAVQTTMPRLFVVWKVQMTMLEAEEAGAGRPATKQGDVEAVLEGAVYALPDDAATAQPDDGTDGEEPKLPSGGTRNPFKKIG